MAEFTPDFSRTGAPPAADGRLDAAAFHRNHAPIRAVLEARLGGAEGHVLEIGSGTGQHAAALARAFPALTWWPTDPLDAHRRSIEAWRRAADAANLRPPMALDAAATDWGLGELGRPPAGDLRAIVCINVVHIAPWAVAQGLIAGAGRHLRADGGLFLYGPFRRGGRHTAPSNEAFDTALRRENPDWGVRDVDDIAALARAAGLALDEAIDMPANNLVLVLSPAGDREGGGAVHRHG